jgi:hypothetical protein
VRGNHAITGPRAIGVERHELDEPHADPTVAAEGGEVDHLVVVDAAHDHAIDLHRVETGVERGVDSGDHPIEVVATGELAEHVGPQRVERDVDPTQAGVGEVVGHLGELDPVAGHGDVDAEWCEHRDQPGQVRPDGGLATGDADRLEAEALHADPDDPGLFLIGEQLVALEPGHAFLGHAVGAAEIAPVGDRHPEVGNAASEGVDQRLHSLRVCDLGHLPPGPLDRISLCVVI